MKKLSLLLVITLIVSALGFTTVAPAKADGVDTAYLEQVFNDSYNSVATLNMQGEINDENVSLFKTASSAGLVSAETIETVTPFISLNLDKFEVIFTAYKNVARYEISNSFDISLYAPTGQGVALIRQKENEAYTQINASTTKQNVDDAVSAFINFLDSNEAVKLVSSISSSEDATLSVTVSAGTNKIFAPDDELRATKFADSVIVKNTKVAIFEHTDVASENGGVGYYFSLRWLRNGAFVTDIPSQEVTVSVSIEDMGLTLQEGDTVQIVRYLGGGEVHFTEANVVGGNVVFTLANFGADIESDYALDFAVVCAGYAIETESVVGDFIAEYGMIVLIAFGVIVFIGLICKAVKRSKKRKLKKEFKAFKKNQKRAKSGNSAPKKNDVKYVKNNKKR